MILRPDGAPAKKRRVPMSRVDVKTVIDFEQWCRANSIALDLYCEKCLNSHGSGKAARMWGNNAKDSTAYHLECNCTDRVYGVDVAARETPRISDPKIQVLVP